MNRRKWTIATVLVIAILAGISFAVTNRYRAANRSTTTTPATFAPAVYPKNHLDPAQAYWCTPPKGSKIGVKARTANACWASITLPGGTKASCGPSLLPFPHLHCWLEIQPGSVVGIDNWMADHPGFSGAAFTTVVAATCGLLTISNPPLSLIMAAVCGIYAAFYESVFEHALHNSATYGGNNGSGPYTLCVKASFNLYYWTGNFPQGMKISSSGYWGWKTVWVNGVDYQRWLPSDKNCKSYVLQPGII